MGAPLGNQNAAKGKRWQAAIERALERRASGQPRPTDVSALIAGYDMAADEFVTRLFEDKDLGYFKELGDRSDGKPKQTIAGDEDAPLEMRIGWKKHST
jgi:hypothetical protein